MAEVREQDEYMPIANIIRIMRKTLPLYARISDEAKETVQECVSEFISFVTAEANEHCQQDQRKTVTAEDLVWAMRKLGFDDYVQPLSLFLHRYRESEGELASVRRTSAYAACAGSAYAACAGSASACALGMGMGMEMHPHPLPVLPNPPPYPHPQQPQPYTHNHGFGMFDFDPTLGFDFDPTLGFDIASASASGPGFAAPAPGFNLDSFDPYGNKQT